MQAKKSFRFWLVFGIVWMSVLFAPISNEAFAEVKYADECMENPEICQQDTKTDAEADSTESASVGIGMWDYIKVFVVLVVVLALLIYVLKILNKRNSKYQQNSVIKNIGGMSVGPQKSVQLLLIGNRIYIVGVGEDVQLLKEVDNEDDVERLLQQYEVTQLTASTVPYIAEIFNKFSKKNQPKDVSDSPNFNEMFNEKIGKLKQERSDEIERWKEQESDKR